MSEHNGIMRTPSGKDYEPKPNEKSADKNELLRIRAKNMFASLRTSYKTPAFLVSGRGQYMYDENGNEFLDCYNNIPHIGHCHPKFVAATTEQLHKVVSNTRYLHDKVTLLAQKLAAKLPEKLSVVMFTNSGSEANDLAMRIARVATRQTGVVCLEGAYHGITIECCKISPHPYYCEGRDIIDCNNVETAPVADTYRGKYRKDDPKAAEKYAAEVGEAIGRLEARGYKCSSFIAETVQGCGGQIVYPPGYLKAVYDIVHAKGGLCIADEVQVGFGRSGSSYWAFESQGVVPDILTIGKSFGNGFPLAALVTTPEIAAKFNGHEYFSSVAGNPVSAAAGMAVLEAIDEDGLQENARVVSEALISSLEKLKAKHPLIGDVRGLGLFIGIELVRSHETLEPATEETLEVREKLYQRRILTGTLGVHDNVLRIKPPMCFTLENADYLANQIDQVFTELEQQQQSNGAEHQNKKPRSN